MRAPPLLQEKPPRFPRFDSFLSSIGSLGSVIRERSRHKKKVEHINELLDKTVSEKVKGSALAGAGKERISGTGPGSIGREPPEQVRDQDPFMSLSGDEFDVSLLDGLDDSEPLSLSPSSGQVPLPSETDGPGRAIPDPDIPLPSLDISSEMDDILKDNEGGLEEFSGLEGGETIDQDFKDLDNLDLENIDLDTGIGRSGIRSKGTASQRWCITFGCSSSGENRLDTFRCSP